MSSLFNAILGAVIVVFASQNAPMAPRLQGLGTHEWKVTTDVPRAQQFFNQGLRLLYAFNHAEALRAFREAARLDPNLAMAGWGQAMALAPNLNAPMSADSGRLAYEAVQAAKRNAASASRREQMLIDALAARFAADPPSDRAALDKAYAAAMTRVAEAFPQDPDVQTFYADAVMNTMPWDYWHKDGSPKPETAKVLAALESVMAVHPRHPGANHYYIHAIEASDNPDRALPSADVLGSLMPAAGHMVHMPAHIYLRVGRYADAAEANVRAIAADQDYLAQCQAQGLYPVSYYPHNLHFLWAAATLEGRRAVAIDAARQVAEKVPHHHAGALAWTADFPVTPWLAYVRFGRWTEILTTPAPPHNAPYATGIWHYARGVAFVARGQFERAAEERRAVDAMAAHEAFKTTLKDTPLAGNLQIASRIVSGELAAKRGSVDESVKLLREAVALEDAFAYNEPTVWHHPVRQILGAVLLEAGKASEAEKVYREDLARVRENGWSLFGLARSLEAQNRSGEALDARRRFDRAWKRADITLESSRIITDDRPPAMKVASVTLQNGVTLNYVEQGAADGVPIVMLHGITDSFRSFEPVLPHLPPWLRVFAISQRGHGDSDKPTAGYQTIDFATDVARFMDALKLPRAIVLGHSMGAANAIRFAADYPGRTAGLIAIGALAQGSGNKELDALQQAFRTLADPVDRNFALEFQLSTIAQSVDPALVDVFVDESVKVPARVWQSALTGVAESDSVALMRRVTAPSLLIWGSKDAVTFRADQNALAAANEHTRLEVYEGAGHAVHWEEPARVASHIVTFAKRLPQVPWCVACGRK